MNENFEKIEGRLGEAEVLAQLAEECTELAQAALKLRRALDGKNPTQNTEEERRRALLEEYTDVIHCALVLDLEMDLVKSGRKQNDGCGDWGLEKKMGTEITLLKWPGEEDWMFAKSCALVTIGKHSGKAPDMEWKHRMLRAKHSPIRTLNFAFYLHNVPYYVSTHLARHVHSVPFVKSQRNDRQSEYDRNAARQDAPVDMIWYMNAEELLTVASKRLCRKADPATQEIVKKMRTLVLDHCPEFRGLMAPPCAFMDECPEMEPCKEGQA